MITRDQRLRKLIREYRVSRGLSQKTVAERAHVSRTTIRRLEHGVGSARRIKEICEALGIDQTILLREAGFDAIEEEKSSHENREG